ncbi:hypothetical protein [Leptolyngbya sp. FACHB-261]|uniref:beta strand repeat-containing protein n=1 Tax=Leptolyngbya sp. FACHB-261 TaxID=2692806 RepID=UPI0016833A5B|nr:hypothetical protein [Leptolyngbya sp. FACHB-261]MBD2101035.1 hypothetical protein [Leptolyngbya sp. FACHB-261]
MLKKPKTTLQYCYRPLLAAAFIVGGNFQLLAPAFAAGTVAGTSISNTATATYTDPNNPTQPINATSNTVVIKVAEVAGITVTSLGTTDTTPATPSVVGDTINYGYKVTNVGNDATLFFVPGTATVSGTATATAGTVQIVGYMDANGTRTNITAVNVPAGGASTAALGIQIGTNPVGAIPAGYSLIVEVPVTINSGATNSSITVVLGNTGANTNAADSQNQPYPTAPTGNDLYTVDGPDGTPTDVEADGAPINGQREASASETLQVGATPVAFATILKTNGGYSNAGTPATLNDDLITYSLGLNVANTTPTGSTGISSANLVGTPINITGLPTGNYILVSDAIPSSTALTGTPSAPSGWTPIYTTTATSTPANQALWTTTQPASGVTRVGFVNSGTVAEGVNITGFAFQVVTSGISGSSTIANIAQVFGQSQGGGTTLVYDESGDQNPNNYENNAPPATNNPTTGVANPTTDGIDSGNNTGTGPGGEVNVFTLNAPGNVLNGPNAQPAAIGPNSSNNTDFTNKSTAIPAGTAPGGKFDPAPVQFNNTVNNPGTGTLTNIVLAPDATNFTASAAESLPPTGTLVTITYNGQTATYTFNGTDFALNTGNTPVIVPSLGPSTSASYTVSVDLPVDTTLSTDTGKGFAIPIYAFLDLNGDNQPDSNTLEPTQNTTIDRVYTGFLKLVKDARVLDTNGTTVVQDYPATPGSTNIPASAVLTGRFIEYRITYTNISSPATGATGSIGLDATNVTVTEKGDIGGNGGNNWALDNDGNGVIDTSNVVGSASAGTTFLPSGDQSGMTAGTDVTTYTNTTGTTILPSSTGTFIFRRRIN